ncbi:Uncharacterized membrane protein YccC [Paenibacillus sp. 1_12]|uniref:FUSC family protein n=1 Tax=Paenibacillus sp. 1_12 TaxID=1566278 RepID=UPI0008EC2632|nr:FUSC family protein [Paenibacillus sp. 1_12]SFL98679.1 Uncharacterized membrane protein YccC [Paenibacillus sp. 1_12]
MHKSKRMMLSGSISPSLNTMIKQAFTINKSPLPWEKAIGAGICSGLPVLLGLLFGSLQYGLIAGIGSFTYLYTFNVPYAHRAKKLFLALLGMTLSVGLGTLLAPYPSAAAIAVGIIGAIAVFVFGAFKMAGPSAIFFVLGFLMSTGMPIDPALAPLRAGLVFVGGALSWILGMIGWFIKPHGPETLAVRNVYTMLADFMDSVGTDHFNAARQKLISTLNAAEETLLAGHLSWHSSDQYKRLLLLNDQANTIFLHILEYCEERSGKLPSELGSSVRFIAASLDHKDNVNANKPTRTEQADKGIYRLLSLIDHADAILRVPMTKISREMIPSSRPSPMTVLGGSFDTNSIVFFIAIRYGVVLTIAAIIANSFQFNHSYWVTLSCAAVMSGSTIVATFHRSIQRSIGTIVGVVIATLILSVKPEGIVIVVAIVLFTVLTELAIVFNYGIAALFITSNSLLMAESTSPLYDFSYFATARIIDVVIGAIIGLVGALLVGSRQASNLLPHLMAKTIRSELQFLLVLFSEQQEEKHVDDKERSKLQIHLSNLKLVFTTALGEIPNNKKALELLWPAMFAIEQLGYLLESCLKTTNRPILSDESQSQLLLVFDTMAKAAEHHQLPSKKTVPEIKGFSKLTKEINELQDALQVSGNDRVSMDK